MAESLRSKLAAMSKISKVRSARKAALHIPTIAVTAKHRYLRTQGESILDVSACKNCGFREDHGCGTVGQCMEDKPCAVAAASCGSGAY